MSDDAAGEAGEAGGASEASQAMAAVFERMGAFSDYLGLRIVSATADEVRATWTAGPHLHQPYGIVHGGAHCGVVETLASVAAAVWAGPDARVVGVSNSTDFYRAVTEGEMRAVATPVHRGRTQQVWVVENHDERGKLVSRGQVRLQNLPAESFG